MDTPAQMSMFDLFRPAPERRRIDRDGEVVRGSVHTVLRLERAGNLDLARIELHPHEGKWMWATGFAVELGGSGYHVGPKWGQFAATHDDALYWAIQEIREGIAKYERSRSTVAIERWLGLYEPRGLVADGEQAS